MNETLNLDFEQIQRLPLHEFTEKAYLEYSMYVILDRALPHVGDGLKPVQRRIIYAMSELGLKSTAKYKKSARTVGDVIGKFHPHGDSACYEAMVLMAQPFTYRYPLVDGQGNWGSIDDPKSFAAMRYTESRLTAYANNLLGELGQGTVEWMPNFDGTLSEPQLLPARLPNILLNGTTGIAVGMATDIPPHNMKEVIQACIKLLQSPKSSVKDLLKYIQGPDFPTKAEIITPRDDIQEIYQTGSGSIRMRAVWEQEDGNIIISALPYQSSGSKILQQINEQKMAKKLPMLDDYRDEGDHENPVRLVLVPRSNRVDVAQLMSHLFATTDLEKTYRVNLNMIGLNGRPQVKNLVTVLKEWLQFRTETVRKRLQFRLDQVIEAIHILEGLMIAYLNIDEVIKIIRNEDEPKQKLVKKFKLSPTQVDAILDLRLRKLAKLEEVRIKGELNDLGKERKSLEQILSSKQRLKTLIKRELEEDAGKYGDDRQSPLQERTEARALNETELVPVEAITIILSVKGWIRAGKGHDIDPKSLNYRSGDDLKCIAHGKSNQPVILIDSTGKCYAMSAHGLPTARSLGEPVSSQLNPPDGATFEGVMIGEDEALYLLSTNAGYGFVARLADLYTKNRSGKHVMTVPEYASVLTPSFVDNYEQDLVVAISSIGRILVFPLCELPVMGKGKGLKIIQIPPKKLKTGEEFVKVIKVVGNNHQLHIISGQRKLVLKKNDLEKYSGERGRRGNMLPRGFRNVSHAESILNNK